MPEDHRRRPRVYGVCPGCHRVRSVRLAGVMSQHGKLTDQGYLAAAHCPGVDQAPLRLADKPATDRDRRLRVPREVSDA